MNIIWCAMIVLSMLYSFINGTAADTLNAGMEAARGSVQTLLSFAGVMCLWSGILKLCETGGIGAAIKKALSPALRLLFGSIKDESAHKLIAMNITANLLGTGNAATPAGVAAMKRLDELNGSSRTPSREMCTFAVLNTCAPTIVPSTVIALLIGGGAQRAYDIIIPVWIVSAVSLSAGLLAVRLICRR